MNIKKINNTNYSYNFDTKELLTKTGKVMVRKENHNGWEITNLSGHRMIISDEPIYVEGTDMVAMESDIYNWTRPTDLTVEEELETLKDLPLLAVVKMMRNCYKEKELVMWAEKNKIETHERHLKWAKRDLDLFELRMDDPKAFMKKIGINDKRSQTAWLEFNKKQLIHCRKNHDRLLKKVAQMRK